jgi:hypothetical protein
MPSEVNYYDVCLDCGSQDLAIRDAIDDEAMLTLACRQCGAEWDDYIDDVRKDYWPTNESL